MGYSSNFSADSNNGGVGFWGLLQVLFIVLKLTHTIDWKWVWVLSPTWISIVLVIIVLIITKNLWGR